MVDLQDALNVEGEAETEEEYFLSLQRYINAGYWSGPGREGRAMMEALESGHCLLGTKAAADYYGNRIPSRTQVQEGTKGSRSFVVERKGEDWATMMEAVS